MNNEIGKKFLLYHTAKDIWKAAKETFSDLENMAEFFKIERILHDFRQGDQLVAEYLSPLVRYWQQLDLYETKEWKCPTDAAMYQKIIEKKQIFKFLLGLNKDLDEVRRRILATNTMRNIREVFAEVRREESTIQLKINEGKEDHGASIARKLGTPRILVRRFMEKQRESISNHSHSHRGSFQY